MVGYKDKLKANKEAAPYLLTEGDPEYIKKRPVEVKPLPAKLKHKSKPNKVLTNLKRFATLRNVNKAKKKGDKMATDNKKTSTKNDKANVLKSIAWLVEAAFRGFVGWVLLSQFDHLATTIAAFYALGTAGVIVVAHFIRANR